MQNFVMFLKDFLLLVFWTIFVFVIGVVSNEARHRDEDAKKKKELASKFEELTNSFSHFKDICEKAKANVDDKEEEEIEEDQEDD